MKCIGCFKEIKKGEFVTLNGGAMVRTKSGAEMGGKDLLGFLVVNTHFDSKKNYKSMSLVPDGPNGQFELYACSHKCMIKYFTRQVEILEKIGKFKKIVIESDNKIKRFRPWVDRILQIIGYPGALVTNKSTIWDFTGIVFERCRDKKKVQEQSILKWSKKLGFKIKGEDYIWKIAEQYALKKG